MTHLEIEAFFEIIKAGSISSAAQNLYVTQPALSRRIKTLEDELGYPLFSRKKGQRNIELTTKGEAFVPIAQKWLNIWQEAWELNNLDSSNILNIASVGSVSSYILPHVFEKIAETAGDHIRICFHNYHSFESYQYVANGLIDIALISDDIYYKGVETIPVFQERMVFVSNNSRNYPETVHPQMLEPDQEIRLPWNPEYDAWHDFWFKSTPEYRVSLDQMNLLEHVLSWKNAWAIVPSSVACKLASLDYVSVYQIASPPPDRIIYYLKSGNKKTEVINHFLTALNHELNTIPGVTSYLGA
ncbi:MAG: LysR family transcriptional regulator [Lachnospiraceae bacterium]|nr:LysR family transcriptional regulator [Lachnospiraceae bacterium]